MKPAAVQLRLFERGAPPAIAHRDVKPDNMFFKLPPSDPRDPWGLAPDGVDPDDFAAPEPFDPLAEAQSADEPIW